MARGRMIDRVIILSKKVNSVSEGAENLYYRLIICADDYGRYHADPEIIKGQVYTKRKINLSVIQKRLKELENIGLIKLYTVDGETYLEIVGFANHQKFRSDIQRKSEYPEPKGFLQSKCIEPDTTRIEPDTTRIEPDTTRCLNLSKDKLNKDNIYNSYVDDSSTPAHQKSTDDFKKWCQNVISQWNEFAQKAGLPAIRAIAPGSKRERFLRARFKEKEFDFQKILEKVGQSEFLLGIKTDWKVSFDWILAPSNYLKILEGTYDSGLGSRDKLKASNIGSKEYFNHPEFLKACERQHQEIEKGREE